MKPLLPDPQPRPAGDRLQTLWAAADPLLPDPDVLSRTLAACRLEQQLLVLERHWPVEPVPVPTLETLARARNLEGTLSRLEGVWPSVNVDAGLADATARTARLEEELGRLGALWPAAAVAPAVGPLLQHALRTRQQESGLVVPLGHPRAGWLGALAAAAVIALTLVRVPGDSGTTGPEDVDLWTLTATETLRLDLESGLGAESFSTLAELDAPEFLEALLEPDPELLALGEEIDLLAVSVEAF